MTKQSDSTYKKIKKYVKNNLEWLVLVATLAMCVPFLVFGYTASDGSKTLDGSEAVITETTKTWIEDANTALNRLMNEDAPTDEETVSANDEEATGQGFYTTIDEILSRRLEDGNNDGGKGFQCSRYTGYLATGKWSYSSSHPDYGPVNGKAVAEWLVKNYGFKYIDTPVKGAIGSGGFNTTYGHTAMYLYSTGTNTAMVNDANYKPLTVATHSMNISGWVWVVPGSYDPTPTPSPDPSPEPSDEPEEPSTDTSTITYVVNKGDTLGAILRAQGYTGKELFGDDGVAQKVATYNKILNRGLIYPNQTIIIPKEYLGV